MEIRDNRLDMTDLNEIITVFPRLAKLKLGGNPITNFNNLNVLAKMGELRKLEIKNIPTISEDELEKKTEKLFEDLKGLEVINNKNRKGESIESSLYEEEDGFEMEDGEEGKIKFQLLS